MHLIFQVYTSNSNKIFTIATIGTVYKLIIRIFNLKKNIMKKARGIENRGIQGQSVEKWINEIQCISSNKIVKNINPTHIKYHKSIYRYNI